MLEKLLRLVGLISVWSFNRAVSVSSRKWSSNNYTSILMIQSSCLGLVFLEYLGCIIEKLRGLSRIPEYFNSPFINPVLEGIIHKYPLPIILFLPKLKTLAHASVLSGNNICEDLWGLDENKNFTKSPPIPKPLGLIWLSGLNRPGKIIPAGNLKQV